MRTRREGKKKEERKGKKVRKERGTEIVQKKKEL